MYRRRRVRNSPAYAPAIYDSNRERTVDAMDIFSVITLLGGLAFFLYGMHVMSQGLEKMTSGKLQATLQKVTSNRFASLLLGAGITIAIQSSSALTVMLVGLVNSGILQFGETISVLMGSNIGTTLTAWILSLAGIESENVWLNLLKPANFSPIFALVGIVLIMVGKRQKQKDIGSILVGFSVLMFGMTLMSGAVEPLADMPQFTSLLTAFENPLLGVLIGTVFTGIIQSSAASVGVLQTLALTGSVSYGMALPIIMGQNIGTCVTALLSSIGVNKNARRVAAVHVSFNVIGTIVCLTLFYGADAFLDFAFVDSPITPLGIAIVHSIFNIFTTLLLLPFTHQLERLACILVQDNKHIASETAEIDHLEDRYAAHPSLAIELSHAALGAMAAKAKENLNRSIDLIHDYSESGFELVQEKESIIDRYEDRLGTFLVSLTAQNLSDAQNKEVSKFLHSIGDFERIGDHAVNLSRTAQEIHEKKLGFSPDAQKELQLITAAVREIVDIAVQAFTSDDLTQAYRVEPLEEVIDSLCDEIKLNHVNRLQKGTCTLLQGFVYNDLITNYERIADHCSNVAVAMIALESDSMDTHETLNSIKTARSSSFDREFAAYSKKYNLQRLA